MKIKRGNELSEQEKIYWTLTEANSLMTAGKQRAFFRINAKYDVFPVEDSLDKYL